MNFAPSTVSDVSKRPLLEITYNGLVGIQPVSCTIPGEFRIYQNYPNPFNPKTKIKFDISEYSFTTLKIFDELGREVDNLINENLNPGNYEVEFNSNNLNSGVYYYKLQSGDFFHTKKMILLK